jgi:hypothetical protein
MTKLDVVSIEKTKIIVREKMQYLFWFQCELSSPDGEGNVRHGCNSAAVHR